MQHLSFFRIGQRVSLMVLAAATGVAQNADLPVVKTADLSAILQGSRPPVEISTRPGQPRPVASISAEGVEWRGEEGKEMARIAALPHIEIKTNGNDLRTTLRTIFERNDMKYYIQDGDPVMDSKVTYSVNNHPWEILKSLADIYNLEIVYRNGLWHCFVKNDQELVAKPYTLKNNTLERFKSSSGGAGGIGSTGGGGGGSSMRGGGGGGSNTPSLDRAGQSVFSVDDKALKDEVEKILGLNVGSGAVIAGPNGYLGTPGARPSKNTAQEPAKGLVSFTADTNTLYVVATRNQHQLLEAWLKDMDKPIKQLYIETKFFLTSVNPKSKMGVGNSVIEDGFGMSLSGLTTEVDPSRIKTYAFPKAIFSADDLSARLNFMARDSNTTAVQYPQQTTLSGREVVLRSVRQIPIVSSSNRDIGGSATSTQSQIEFVDVGTVVSILPKVLDEKNIMLSISITVSSISETVMIDGNPYPVVTNQTYNNQVMVESGYSLALGGLEQTLNTDENVRVPGLGKIPFFGFLFKEESKQRSRSVLTMIVTPSVMQGYNGGNTSGIAQHTIAARGTPARKAFVASESSGADEVNVALVGFGDEVLELEQFRKEGRFDSRATTRAKLLINELDLMEIALDREEINGRVAKELSGKINTFRKRLNNAINDKVLAGTL